MRRDDFIYYLEHLLSYPRKVMNELPVLGFIFTCPTKCPNMGIFVHFRIAHLHGGGPHDLGSLPTRRWEVGSG